MVVCPAETNAVTTNQQAAVSVARPYSWIKQALIAIGMFVTGWTVVILYTLWGLSGREQNWCRFNLRALYAASRRVPAQKRGSLVSVERVLGTSFLVTQREHAYLYPTAAEHMMSYTGPIREALICPADPEFANKMAMAESEALDFEPSYSWCPHPDVMAYCPFHHLVLLKSGEIEKR